MGVVGQSRRIVFWIADITSNPVTGYALSNFAITFHRDGLPCPDQFELIDRGDGSYDFQYIPSNAGIDSILIDDNLNDLHYCDIEQIDDESDADSPSESVTVNQNYGGPDALLPNYPSLTGDVLYAFLNSDWSTGNTAPAFAQGSYQLDSTGNWSLSLLPGTYALVLQTTAGSTIVFETGLIVASSEVSTSSGMVEVNGVVVPSDALGITVEVGGSIVSEAEDMGTAVKVNQTLVSA